MMSDQITAVVLDEKTILIGGRTLVGMDEADLLQAACFSL